MKSGENTFEFTAVGNAKALSADELTLEHERLIGSELGKIGFCLKGYEISKKSNAPQGASDFYSATYYGKCK